MCRHLPKQCLVLFSFGDKGAAFGQRGKTKIFDDRHADYSVESMIGKIEALYSKLTG